MLANFLNTHPIIKNFRCHEEQLRLSFRGDAEPGRKVASSNVITEAWEMQQIESKGQDQGNKIMRETVNESEQ